MGIRARRIDFWSFGVLLYIMQGPLRDPSRIGSPWYLVVSLTKACCLLLAVGWFIVLLMNFCVCKMDLMLQ